VALRDARFTFFSGITMAVVWSPLAIALEVMALALG